MASLDNKIWKMNIKTTFLNDYLKEAIYLVQLKGFMVYGQKQRISKLKRFIYGFKQASRS